MSDGSGPRRGSDVSVRWNAHVAAGEVDVHADGVALLGHLDQTSSTLAPPLAPGEPACLHYVMVT